MNTQPDIYSGQRGRSRSGLDPADSGQLQWKQGRTVRKKHTHGTFRRTSGDRP